MGGASALNMNQVNPSYFSMGAAALSQSVANPYYVPGGAGVIGSKTVSKAQLLRPFPAFGDINISGSDQNKGQYDSLMMRAQKRLSGWFTFLHCLSAAKG